MSRWGDGNKTVVSYPMIIIPLSIVWWEAKNISGKHSCILPISSKSFLHLLLTTFYWNIFRYKWQKIHILESNQEFAKFVDCKKAVFLRWSGMRVPVKRVVWSEGENVFLRPPSKRWGSGISKHVSGQMMTHVHKPYQRVRPFHALARTILRKNRLFCSLSKSWHIFKHLKMALPWKKHERIGESKIMKHINQMNIVFTCNQF